MFSSWRFLNCQKIPEVLQVGNSECFFMYLLAYQWQLFKYFPIQNENLIELKCVCITGQTHSLKADIKTEKIVTIIFNFYMHSYMFFEEKWLENCYWNFLVLQLKGNHKCSSKWQTSGLLFVSLFLIEMQREGCREKTPICCRSTPQMPTMAGE